MSDGKSHPRSVFYRVAFTGVSSVKGDASVLNGDFILRPEGSGVWRMELPEIFGFSALCLSILDNRTGGFEARLWLEGNESGPVWIQTLVADLVDTTILNRSNSEKVSGTWPDQVSVTSLQVPGRAPAFRIASAPSSEEVATMMAMSGGSPGSDPSICDCQICRILYYDATVSGITAGDECGIGCLVGNATWRLENEQPHNLQEVCGWWQDVDLGQCDFQDPRLSIGYSHEMPCQAIMHFSYGGIDSPAWEKHFGPGEWPPTTCLTGPTTLTFARSSFGYCNYSESTVVITPVLPEDLTLLKWEAAQCMPRTSCCITVPVPPPRLDVVNCTFEEQCCPCGSDLIPDPPLPGIACGDTGSCGCMGRLNLRNGNLALNFSMPNAGKLGAIDSFTYNSGSSFGDCSAGGCSAGRGTSSMIQRSVTGSIDSVLAYVTKCDGSQDWYHCLDESTNYYVPYPGVLNTLKRLLDGFGDLLGWEEKDGPKTYEFNADGELTRIKLDCGNGTSQEWQFNRNSPLSSITDPVGRRTTYAYNGSGYLRRIEDPYNRRTTFVVNAGGYLTHHVTPELCTTELRYNAGDQLIASISPEGLRTSYSYDTIGWCNGVTTPSGARYTYTYRDVLTTRITEPGNAVTTVVHDLLRNIRAVINPLGNRVSYTYSGTLPTAFQSATTAQKSIRYTLVSGNRMQVHAVTTNDGITTYVYDTSGRAIASINPLGQRSSVVRSTNGVVKARINSLGLRTTISYAAFGPSAVIDPLGHRTTTLYDSLGQVSATINPLGHRTTMTWINGQRRSTRSPVGAISTVVYDVNNRVRANINPLADRTTNVYDAGCRVIATVQSNGARTTNVYAFGRQVATINPLGLRFTLVYSGNGHRVATISPMLRRSTTVYDIAGRPVAAISPSGLRTTTILDAGGRVVASIDSAGLRSTTIYDTCCSRPKATVAPNAGHGRALCTTSSAVRFARRDPREPSRRQSTMFSIGPSAASIRSENAQPRFMTRRTERLPASIP